MFHPRSGALTLVAVLLASTFATPCSLGQTIRAVRATGVGAAPPWNAAYPNLQSALSAAQPGDEIWIAAGTHVAPPGDGFVIPSNVLIYGGFAGIETRRADRSADPAANQVVLTNNSTTNHTLTFNATGPQTLIDRVTLRGSPHQISSSTTQDQANGGAINATAAAFTFTNCAFTSNVSGFYRVDSLGRFSSGGHGGCGYLSSCTAAFLDCTFSGNRATAGGAGCASGSFGSPGPSGSGGALYILGGATTLVNCTLTLNEAGDAGRPATCGSVTGNVVGTAGAGGAIWVSGGVLQLVRCQFLSNAAGDGVSGTSTNFGLSPSAVGERGGAVFASSVQLTADSCTFDSNTAGQGAAGFHGASTTVVATRGGEGGAIYASGATALITNCVFRNNRGGNGGSDTIGFPGIDGASGGAYYGRDGGTTLVNCTLTGNSPGAGGGGTPPGALGAGGGIDAMPGAAANCILWGNTSHQYASLGSLTNCCVQGDPPGTGGISIDPLFVNVSTGDLRLRAGSPCVDTGASGLLEPARTLDVAGRPRRVFGCDRLRASTPSPAFVDIGAHEFQNLSTDCNADGLCDAFEVAGTDLFLPSTPQSWQQYGWAVAMSADLAVVGSRGKMTSAGIGSGDATVYDRASGSFSSPHVLAAPDAAPNDDFGNQVAIADRWVFVGARFADVTGREDAGAAYIFRREGISPAFLQKLVAPDAHPGDQFAHGLAADGSRVACGALRADAPGISKSGAVYLYTLSSAGTFAPETKLTALDAASQDGLGISVGLSGSTLVAGAPYRTEGGQAVGVAYVFELVSGTWTQTAKLVAPGGAAGDTFGELVAISGDTIVVNAPRRRVGGRANAGAVFIYTRVNGQWFLATMLTSNNPESSELFGFGLALQPDTLAIGGFSRKQAPFTRSGGTYIFRNVPSGWRLAARIDSPEPQTDAFFGYALALSGDRCLVGIPQQHVRGVQFVGAARLYNLALLDSNFNNIPDSCDFQAGVLSDANQDGLPDNIPWTYCATDIDGNGRLDSQDIFSFLSSWFAHDPLADFDLSGTLDQADIFAFLGSWFSGC